MPKGASGPHLAKMERKHNVAPGILMDEEQIIHKMWRMGVTNLSVFSGTLTNKTKVDHFTLPLGSLPYTMYLAQLQMVENKDNRDTGGLAG